MRTPGSAPILVLAALMPAVAAAQSPSVSPPAAATEAPQGVSPGDAAQFLPIETRCPTFSWTAVTGARGYEIVVYDAAAQAGRPSLEAGLPAGATSWTPAADRCLAAGERYGWSVRAVTTATTTDRVGGLWSEALLFEVAVVPSDLAAALALLSRELGPEGLAAALAASGGSDPAAAADRPGSGFAEDAEGLPPTQKSSGAAQQGVGGPLIAVRGEVPDAAGETYGVRGLSNSPSGAGVRADNNASGADLILGGSPVASLTETSFSRDSASNLTFDFTNPGAGTMSLQVDGDAVFHAGNDGAESGLDADLLDGLDSTDFVTSATDDWVDETGDTMTGTLTLSPAAGNALTTTAGNLALHTSATVTKAGARFLWDDAASASFGAGRGALAANTTGGNDTAVGSFALNDNTTGYNNTAVGASALDRNTTGSSNTGLGSYALFANTTASNNTAVGADALSANTTGFRNTAVGALAMDFTTTGSDNTVVGAFALDANTTGSDNTALGSRALGASTVGFGNTALGSRALETSSGVTANNNTAVGAHALRYNTTGQQNTALGAHALITNTTGSGNTALGTYALSFSSTGHDNTAVGTVALFNNTTGYNNTALGAAALETGTTARRNTAVGALALRYTTSSGNTALGAHALTTNSTGYRNTAVGSQALQFSTTGDSNTAVGALSLYSSTTGSANTAVGYRALMSSATAGGNTALGFEALKTNTVGFQNTAVGGTALYSNTTGSYNTALGNGALHANTLAYGNTGLGAFALFANTTGSYNTAAGRGALGANTTAASNTAVGARALVSNTSGPNNTAVGRSALQANTTAPSNTAVGAFALDSNTGGHSNTALGANAMGTNTLGLGNTALGTYALASNTAGSQNIAVGYRAGYSATTGHYNIFIGHEGFGGDAEVIRLGTPGVHSTIGVAGIRGVTTGLADAVPVLIDSSGQLGTINSSRRLKTDIQDIGAASEPVLALRPVSFRYKEHVKTGQEAMEFGLIAEEVAQVFPELLVYGEDGQPETVRYHLLVPLLLNELQEAKREIRELQAARPKPGAG